MQTRGGVSVLHRDTLPATEVVTEFLAGDGRPFQCVLPRPAPPPPSQEKIREYAIKDDMQYCQRVLRPRNDGSADESTPRHLRRTPYNSCIVLTSGYWTYQVCPGHRVR